LGFVGQHYNDIFNALRELHFAENVEVEKLIFRRPAIEACSAMWIFGNNLAFAQLQRKSMEKHSGF
jgi:hypothetical protein